MLIDVGNDDYIILCNFGGHIMSEFEIIERLRAGYPASRGYIFAVGAGARKVASADNCSISIGHARNSSRDLQAKLIVRSVVKWREFRGNKKLR